MLHPLYQRLLDRFCEEYGFNPQVLAQAAEGRREIPKDIRLLLAKVLDVPKSAWRKPPPVPDGSPLVSLGSDGQDDTVIPEIDTLSDPPVRRRRRRLATPVHLALDTLGWTVKDLAEAVAGELGRPVSRASMQFWVTGSRKIRRRKTQKKSVDHAVQAPEEVRMAAYQVTKRETLIRRLPESAVLHPDAWPNVEPQAQ